jgi:hypothetical protein
MSAPSSPLKNSILPGSFREAPGCKGGSRRIPRLFQRAVAEHNFCAPGLVASLFVFLATCGKEAVNHAKWLSATLIFCTHNPKVMPIQSGAVKHPYISLTGSSYGVLSVELPQTLVDLRRCEYAFFSTLSLYFPRVIDSLHSALYRIQTWPYTEVIAGSRELFTASRRSYGGEES